MSQVSRLAQHVVIRQTANQRSLYNAPFFPDLHFKGKLDLQCQPHTLAGW